MATPGAGFVTLLMGRLQALEQHDQQLSEQVQALQGAVLTMITGCHALCMSSLGGLDSATTAGLNGSWVSLPSRLFMKQMMSVRVWRWL